jgi:hypothetical protein
VVGSVASDPETGLLIPQARLTASPAPYRWDIVGHVTFRCHSCGELITKPWECLFVDDTPGAEWASSIEPPRVTVRTTTHHASHMAA